MLTDQANYQWWLIQMWIPNYFYLFGSFKNSSMVCFGASQRTFPVPQRSQDVMGKKTQWQNVNILPRIIRPLSLFLWWNLSDSCSCSRSHTPPNSQQGSSLTLRNPVSCADSAKKKREVPGMVSLPPNSSSVCHQKYEGFWKFILGPYGRSHY